MTQDQFDKAFKFLSSNPWQYDLSESKLKRTRPLFFHKLKDYSFEAVYKAFDGIVSDKKQERFPSIQRILCEIDSAQPVKQARPRPKRSEKSKKVIRFMFKETRKILGSSISGKKSAIRKMTDVVKEKLSSDT
ncbi:MAG: hypothetical protein H8D23_40935 [Candidatus Brocadiales bacterium]|nr:hypothetical protein [Candidatus Brocadiales bacterium]